MWRNDHKRTVIRNIILAVLFLAICVGMVYAYLYVDKQNEEQDALLAQAYTVQQQEQTAVKEQELADIEAAYQKDLDTLAEYLPGVVCWGDSLTAGSSGNVSYPSILQKYINAYICNIYDFRSSVTNADDYSRLDWTSYKVSIPVVNMGAGDEDSRTILGRAGVEPYVVKEDFTIPVQTEQVEVEFTSPDGKTVTPLIGGSAGVNNVVIGGVEGTLALDPESYRHSHNTYYFTRLKPGAEVTVPAGTEITTAAADQYKDYIHVICIGTYGGYDSVTQLVEQTKAMVERQTKNTDRYIVLGLCSTNSYGFVSYDTGLDSIDTAMLQAFGNHYVNVRKYLCSDALTDPDVNISWTNDDRSYAKQGVIPKSLRSSTGDSELNSTAYQIIGRLVYDRMDSLGYFNEIKEELYITETIKQLIKENPTYLDDMLANTLSGLV